MSFAESLGIVTMTSFYKTFNIKNTTDILRVTPRIIQAFKTVTNLKTYFLFHFIHELLTSHCLSSSHQHVFKFMFSKLQ